MTRRRTVWLALMTACTSVAACAHESSVRGFARPPETTGPPISSYSVALAGSVPAGDVHVISFGEVRLAADPGQPQAYLHLRLAAENNIDDVRWTLDPNDQELISSGQAVLPSFAQASGKRPVLSLARGTRGTLDVYYPLPAAGDGARVTLAWRLRRGSKIVRTATVFDRVQSQSTVYVYYQPALGPTVYSSLGLDCWWWSDYYFWHHDSLWWPYPRAYFGHRYRAGYDREADTRPWVRETVWPPADDRSIWRSGTGDSAAQSQSSWRSTTPESSGDGNQEWSPSGNGGNGKSSWRGGGGP